LVSSLHKPRTSPTHTIDFKNPKALRELTAAILWTQFQLRLEVPLDSLVPPIPNRLGYVCWTEHLAKPNAAESQGPSHSVHAIDIGTGASCIYPLLACKRNEDWSFLALDIDTRQIEYATENVKRNKLEARIAVVLNEVNDRILPPELLGDREYKFCMCNPPFFKDEAQIRDARLAKAEAPSQASHASRTEMITHGGELAFLLRLLDESVCNELHQHIEWFTSLVGRREDYDLFVAELLERELVMQCAEFRNGKTVRWGIAWTFQKQ
ncbi:ribosomal RNA large subunit methyltransferase F-like protein, partial [Chytriomyces sp. MP71]